MLIFWLYECLTVACFDRKVVFLSLFAIATVCNLRACTCGVLIVVRTFTFIVAFELVHVECISMWENMASTYIICF